MKAYKVFENDWTCRGFDYSDGKGNLSVGKVFSIETPILLCHNGFHGCKKMIDCSYTYPIVPFSKFAEVDIFGDIQVGDSDTKICGSSIMPIRELTYEEVIIIINEQDINFTDTPSKGITDSSGVRSSSGVNRSSGVNMSYGVNGSSTVNNSAGVHKSSLVNDSLCVKGSSSVNCSYGVSDSLLINYSSGVDDSLEVNKSSGISLSSGVNSSSGVNISSGVTRSFGIYNSEGVSNSSGVSGSFGVSGCYGVSNYLFAYNKDNPALLFNKEVTNDRFYEVKSELDKKLKGWRPTFNNLRSLYLKSGSKWEETPINKAAEIQKTEAWSGMPTEAINYLRSLPEFDSAIFEKITGIKINN